MSDLLPATATITAPAIPAPLQALYDAAAAMGPQFELSPDRIGKGGLVKDPADDAVAQARVLKAAADLGWQVRHWLPSSIVGGDGNREYFLIAQRAGSVG